MKQRFEFHALATAIAALFAGHVHADVRLQAASPINSTERINSSAAEQVQAPAAHDLNIMGKGAVVAVIDSGIMAKHKELSGHVMAGYNATTNKSISSGAATDGLGHGTHVAGIIAAAMNNAGMYGVAPQASLIPVQVFAAPTWSGTSTALTSGINFAAKSTASIFNMSLGGSAPLGINVESALQNAVAKNKLIIAAAGNSGLSDPSWPARYAKESWAAGSIIAVGAVDSNNQMASFSNRAGDTANWYVVAPGVNVLSTYNNGGYVYMSGTSMATPVVSGAAALIKSRWTKLTAPQIADIIFVTATDLGAPGVDAIYGHGLLNVAAAMQPVGTLQVKTTSGWVAAATASMQISPALSGAAKITKVTQTAFDNYQRDYKIGTGATALSTTTTAASSSVSTAAVTTSVRSFSDQAGNRYTMAWVDVPATGLALSDTVAGATRQMRASEVVVKNGDGELAFATLGLAGNYFGLAGSGMDLPPIADATANPYLALAAAGTQIAGSAQLSAHTTLKIGVLTSSANSAWMNAEAARGGHALVAEVDHRDGDFWAGLQYAQVEENGLLGTRATESYGLSRHLTRVLTLSGAWQAAPDLTLSARASFGYSAGSAGEGIITGVSGVRSQSFALAAHFANLVQKGDVASITLSSPLAATSGTMHMAWASDFDTAGKPIYTTQSVSLASAARELKLGLDYQRPLGRNAQLSLGAAMRHNADNLPGNKDAVLTASYRLAF
ncbi:MAG: S8 family serine peptidase [Rhodocyclaceae bacterium]|nr:S8 family serine peptidase [Rhodocyclaceae bacterium]MBX3668423.1 S8 family serine peptidase [Rhodocyclaceae bacterium]